MAAGRRIIATTAGEALERARALAAQQPMLFRGQTAPWPALATLHRLDADGRAKAREAFARLLDWAEAAPAARALAAEPLAAIAAARHYGLAAPILDLTASPEIALHFALEGAADPGAEAPPQPGVIYAWPRQALAAEPGLRLIDTDGPGVWAGFWRMRAQELVAVHHEDPDARLDLLGEGVAILFPHSPDERAPLTRSERAQPLEASPIERLLEDRAAAASDPGAPAPPSGAPRPAIPAVMFGRATPPLAEGWAEVDPGWTAPPRPEPGAPGETLELAAALREAATAIGLPADLAAGDPAAEPTLAGDLRQAVLAWLGARAGRLRSSAPPRWSVDLPAVSRAARAPLEAALNGFSERMAGAPIDAKRWTAAHASLLTLAALGRGEAAATRAAFEALFGPARPAALTHLTGGVGVALLSRAGAAAALRTDLGELLTPYHAKRAEADPLEFAALLRAPALLAPFSAFVELHLTEIAPTEALFEAIQAAEADRPFVGRSALNPALLAQIEPYASEEGPAADDPHAAAAIHLHRDMSEDDAMMAARSALTAAMILREERAARGLAADGPDPDPPFIRFLDFEAEEGELWEIAQARLLARKFIEHGGLAVLQPSTTLDLGAGEPDPRKDPAGLGGWGGVELFALATGAVPALYGEAEAARAVMTKYETLRAQSRGVAEAFWAEVAGPAPR